VIESFLRFSGVPRNAAQVNNFLFLFSFQDSITNFILFINLKTLFKSDFHFPEIESFLRFSGVPRNAAHDYNNISINLQDIIALINLFENSAHWADFHCPGVESFLRLSGVPRNAAQFENKYLRPTFIWMCKLIGAGNIHVFIAHLFASKIINCWTHHYHHFSASTIIQLTFQDFFCFFVDFLLSNK
jgi:hypothetical protein